MAELKNEFSWSKRRARNFADCKRLYWFSTYGTWPGWKETADARTKEIYLINKVKSRWMWSGEIVHGAIARILRSFRDGGSLDPNHVLATLRDKMRGDFASSRDKRYRLPGQQKTCALREHEFDESVAKADWEKVVTGAENCVSNFIKSALAVELKSLKPDQWLTIDEETPASFVHEGVRVWSKIDVAHRTPVGIRIIDWKTSKSEDEWSPLQLAVYGLYAMATWGGAPDSIRVGLCDLSNPDVIYKEERVSPSDLQAARDQIRDDVAAMEKNLRSSKDENKALEGDYPGTDKPKICRTCNFTRLCTVKPQQ